LAWASLEKEQRAHPNEHRILDREDRTKHQKGLARKPDAAPAGLEGDPDLGNGLAGTQTGKDPGQIKEDFGEIKKIRSRIEMAEELGVPFKIKKKSL